METRTLHIRLPEDLIAWLETQADFHGLTTSAELRMIATRAKREWERTENKEEKS